MKRLHSRHIIGNSVIFLTLLAPMSYALFLRTGLHFAAWAALGLLPIFLLFYAIRARVRNFRLFIFLHILMLLLPLPLYWQDFWIFIILQLFMLISVVVSCYLKYSGGAVPTGLLLLIALLFCGVKALLAINYNADSMASMTLFMMLMLTACHVAYNQMGRLDESLATFSTRANTDDRWVLAFNNAMLAGFLGISAIGAIIISWAMDHGGFSALNAGLSFLGRQILAAIRAFFTWMSQFSSQKEDPEVILEPEPEVFADNSGMMPIEPGGDPSWLMKALETLTLVGGGLLILYLLYLVARTLLRRLYQSFGQSTDVVEDLLPSQVKRSSLPRSNSKSFGFGPERRIRKRYFRTVKSLKIPLSPTDTTGDICARAPRDIGGLTAEYERARYDGL